MAAPRFEPNRGQASATVRFLSRSDGRELHFEPHRVVLRTRGPAEPAFSSPATFGFALPHRYPSPPDTIHEVAMRWLDGLLPTAIEPSGDLDSRVHYFRSPEPSTWITSVPEYSSVRYRQVYPKIDLVAYNSDSNLEYDFEVQPGGDPNRIVLEFSGASQVRLDKSGDLILETAAGPIRHRRPVARQPGGRTVPAGWRLGLTPKLETL